MTEPGSDDADEVVWGDVGGFVARTGSFSSPKINQAWAKAGMHHPYKNKVC